MRKNASLITECNSVATIYRSLAGLFRLRLQFQISQDFKPFFDGSNVGSTNPLHNFHKRKKQFKTWCKNDLANTESVKLCTLHDHMPVCLACSHAKVVWVLTCSCANMPCMLSFQSHVFFRFFALLCLSPIK